MCWGQELRNKRYVWVQRRVQVIWTMVPKDNLRGWIEIEEQLCSRTHTHTRSILINIASKWQAIYRTPISYESYIYIYYLAYVTYYTRLHGKTLSSWLAVVFRCSCRTPIMLQFLLYLCCSTVFVLCPMRTHTRNKTKHLPLINCALTTAQRGETMWRVRLLRDLLNANKEKKCSRASAVGCGPMISYFDLVLLFRDGQAEREGELWGTM